MSRLELQNRCTTMVLTRLQAAPLYQFNLVVSRPDQSLMMLAREHGAEPTGQP